MKPHELLFTLLLFSGASLCLAQESGSVPSSPPQPQAEGQRNEEHILQDGTPVTLALTQDLSSGSATVGQKISFAVTEEIDVDGVTVLRKGEIATGTVTEAVPRKRMGRAGRLSFSIDNVSLADGEKAGLRAVNDAKGDSHVAGMVGLMASMPVVSAPFFLLMHGENTTIPKGTSLTAFVNGDVHLDLTRFGPVAAAELSTAALTSVEIDSDPSGADAEVDGAGAGRTPVRIKLAPGSHSFAIWKSGFAEWRQSAPVTGAIFNVNAVLQEAGAPK